MLQLLSKIYCKGQIGCKQEYAIFLKKKKIKRSFRNNLLTFLIVPFKLGKKYPVRSGPGKLGVSGCPAGLYLVLGHNLANHINLDTFTGKLRQGLSDCQGQLKILLGNQKFKVLCPNGQLKSKQGTGCEFKFYHYF